MNEWQYAYLLVSAQISAVVFAVGIWPLGGNKPPGEGTAAAAQRWRRLIPAAAIFCAAGFAASFLLGPLAAGVPWWKGIFREPLCYPTIFSAAILLIAVGYRRGMRERFPKPEAQRTDPASGVPSPNKS